MAGIDDLLDRHTEALERLTDREALVFRREYRRASTELVAQLAAVSTDDAEQRLRIMLAQVRHGQAELERRLSIPLDQGVRKAEEKALRDLVTTIRKAEKGLGETAGAIEVAALRRLTKTRALALHHHSLKTYTAVVVNALQRDLVQSTAQGEGVDALERRLRRTLLGSKLESRSWLIARMELSRAYNDAELLGIREADRTLPGGMLKRIHETKDRRNHPFSRASHGVTAKASEVFKVSAAKVAAAAAALGKSSGGILWDRKGADYVGYNLPAHFGERGRVVPWREAWAEPPVEEPEPEKGLGEAVKKPPTKAEKLDRFLKAEKALEKAEKAAEKLGLDPHRYRDSLGETVGRQGMVRRIGRVEKRVEIARLATETYEADWALDTLKKHKARLATAQKELKALDRVTRAYRKTVRLAPSGWQEAERRRWGRGMMKSWPRLTQDAQAIFDENLAMAFRSFQPDHLRLLHADFEEIRHTASNSRAYASPPELMGQGGYVVQDLRDLAKRAYSRDGVGTLSHELAHRLDGVLGTSRSNGAPWEKRPGYEDAPRIWRAAFGKPFDKAKIGGRGTLPNGDGQYHLGNWVKPYEARIYGSEDGPIEFIAMANSYRAETGHAWREGMTMVASDVGDTREVWERLIDVTTSQRAYTATTLSHLEAAGQEMGLRPSRLKRSTQLYGNAHRNALEELYGDGERLAEELAGSTEWRPKGPERDREVVATAVLLRGRFGTKLERTIGPDGVLSKLLSKPVDLQKVPKFNPKASVEDDLKILRDLKL